jgi:hypothetical protein
MQLPFFPVEQRCTDCDRELENEGIPRGCGALLCEACYDRVHEEHGESFSGLEVHFSSGRNEWYTPRWLVDLVIRVLGRIDLDPCSNSRTQPNVPARRHFTVHEDGLSREWSGRVFMNPPHGAQLSAWIRKLKSEHEAGCSSCARMSETVSVPSRTGRLCDEELGPRFRKSGHGSHKELLHSILWKCDSPACPPACPNSGHDLASPGIGRLAAELERVADAWLDLVDASERGR